MDSMASGSQVSVEAKQSDTLHALVANPGSQGASSGSSSELNTQSVSELMASLNLNPLAKDFVPSSNLRINPNQGLNHLAHPDHQMYPGMEIQGHPNHGSTWRNHYNNESQEVRYRTRRTVFVSSIDNNVTEEQLAELFSNQGQVSRAELKYFFETSSGEVSVMRHLRDGIHATSMAFIEFVTCRVSQSFYFLLLRSVICCDTILTALIV
ncbi:polyadenylate-binding protein-interacting protein 9-like protein [Tanacetum coccineum]